MDNNYKHIIDCDRDPIIPRHMYIADGGHCKGGLVQWDPSKIELLSLGCADTNAVRKELCWYKDDPVMNACVLDYLIAKQYLIPRECEHKHTFFFGTIFASSGGFSGSWKSIGGACFAPYLYKHDGQWKSGLQYLGDNWNTTDDVAAVLSKWNSPLFRKVERWYRWKAIDIANAMRWQGRFGRF